jgi:hypothetical protein
MVRVPSGNRATIHAKELGPEVWNEYKDRREHYKGQGLTPREAIERAYVELEIGERWSDFRNRRRVQNALGVGVPLTPGEMQAVSPDYVPPGSTKAEEIGDEEMSPVEQVKWAMKMAARVQNGSPAPTRFPCDGALFWFQSAIGNRQEFQKVVLRVDAPGGDPDNLYLQDSQHQYSEIEKNLRECLKEVGDRILELAEEWKEKRGGEQSVGEV